MVRPRCGRLSQHCWTLAQRCRVSVDVTHNFCRVVDCSSGHVRKHKWDKPLRDHQQLLSVQISTRNVIAPNRMEVVLGNDEILSVIGIDNVPTVQPEWSCWKELWDLPTWKAAVNLGRRWLRQTSFNRHIDCQRFLLYELWYWHVWSCWASSFTVIYA